MEDNTILVLKFFYTNHGILVNDPFVRLLSQYLDIYIDNFSFFFFHLPLSSFSSYSSSSYISSSSSFVYPWRCREKMDRITFKVLYEIHYPFESGLL